MSNEGKKVSVHYVGTLDDGSKFDSSRDRGTPLDFTCMAGQMIPGFDIAVRDMEVGQTVNIRIEPKDAYGERDENAMMPVPRRMLQGEPIAGAQVMLMSPQGQPVPAVIASFDDEKIILETQNVIISYPVTRVSVGKNFFRSSVSRGHPMVEKGHRAELNQVSSVSGSWRRAPPHLGHLSGAVFDTTVSPQASQ